MFKKKGSHSSSHSSHLGHSAAAIASHESVNHGSDQGFSSPFVGGTPIGGFTGVHPFGDTLRLGLAYDIYQDGDSLIVEIPFPRLSPETLTIVQENRVLKVSGSTHEVTTKQCSKSGSTKIPLFVQTPQGYFEEIIQLPLAVQEDAASATYENGVLSIRIKLIGSGRENKIPVSFA
jgi:HSP20 family molecular chaperone IbpA